MITFLVLIVAYTICFCSVSPDYISSYQFIEAWFLITVIFLSSVSLTFVLNYFENFNATIHALCLVKYLNLELLKLLILTINIFNKQVKY